MTAKEKYIIIILSIILIIITILFRITHHTPDPPNPQPQIDSLQNIITTYQDSIANLQLQRDTIRDTIHYTRTIRIQVPETINHLPPDSLLATFNNITQTTSILIQTGEALVPLPAIRQSTIALTQNPMLKKEIDLLEQLTINQGTTITIQDSIINQQSRINTLRETQITTLENEKQQAEKKVKRWKIISALAGASAVLVLIIS